MALNVSDLHDLVVLVEKNPEWQSELRRILLTNDLLSLPEIVRELAQAQQRTEESLKALAQRMDTMVGAMERLERQQEYLNGQVSELKGWQLEARYRERAHAYFSKLMLRIHVLPSEELANLLDKALDEGKITHEHRERILDADVVLHGRWREDNREVYLVVEVSVGIDAHDVQRAYDRAAYLSQLSPAVPAVAGVHINLDAAQAAQDLGVWRVMNGSTRAPSDPL